MCSDGNPIKAREAVNLGIADKIIEGDLLEGAITFALEIAGKPVPRTRERNEKLHDVPSAIFQTAREQARQKSRGLRAPLAAIDAVEASTKLDFTAGCEEEARLFNECLFSTEARALIHVFFGERAVAKIPGISKDLKPIEIRRAAVIGAGTMGGGIAMNYANAGIPVIVKETTQEALDRGIGIIRNNYAKTVAKGKLAQEAMDQRMALITPQVTYDGFEHADIITEAVFENMALKKQIFAELDKITKPGAILATNTSTLDIDEIAGATSKPRYGSGHIISSAQRT